MWAQVWESDLGQTLFLTRQRDGQSLTEKAVGSVERDVGGHRHHAFMVCHASCVSVDWNPYSSIGFARQCGCSTIPWLNWISSYPMKKVLHADMQLYMIQWLLAHAPMIAGPWSNDCWSNGCWPMVSPYLSAIDGLTQLYTFKQNLQNCEPIDLSRFVVDLRERHMEYWTPHSGTHPREHNSKRPTYHQRCALPEGIWSLIRLISYPNTCFSTCLVMSFAVQLVSDFVFTPYVLRQRLESK